MLSQIIITHLADKRLPSDNEELGLIVVKLATELGFDISSEDIHDIVTTLLTITPQKAPKKRRDN